MAPSAAFAQFPAELAGRVTDAATGAPVEGAYVEVVGLGRGTLTGADGLYSLRGLEAARHVVRVSRLGYRPVTREVVLRQGRRTWRSLKLLPRPIELAEIRADVPRADGPETLTIERSEIERSGARTVAELLDGRPGLVLSSRGPGGRQTLSIRGSGADRVLVLLDGIPLNDPVGGAADLSSVPISQVESVTVLRGGRSVRYGPGAAAGVVLIESRRDAGTTQLRASTGSLGEWSVAGEDGGTLLGLSVSGGARVRRTDGRFEYVAPTRSTELRRNADVSEASAFFSAAGTLAGGELRARAGHTRLDRGLPGRSFLPSPEAREELRRWRGALAWERAGRRTRVDVRLDAASQRVHVQDPAPPAGLPFDNRTDALTAGARAAVEANLAGPLESVTGGVELRRQSYHSDQLAETAPDGRLDLGAFVRTRTRGLLGSGPRLAAALRLDRDRAAWRVSHEVAARSRIGPLAFHLRHASSYAPPTLGDQYFKAGVGVEPNPDLRAERVPSELGLGIALEGSLADGVAGRLSLDRYDADIRDMIVWAPDFRFVWSPRNVDVDRQGLEAQAELLVTAARLRLGGSYSLARVVYDRPGPTVQVTYRPRHSGALTGSWRPADWELRLDLRFTGVRHTVPAPVNTLDSFWTAALRLRRTLRLGTWRLTPLLHVDRLFDQRDSLIFGYPEPGRTYRFELAVQPAGF